MPNIYDLFFNPYLNNHYNYNLNNNKNNSLENSYCGNKRPFPFNKNSLANSTTNSNLNPSNNCNNSNKKQKVQNLLVPDSDILETNDSFIIETELVGVNKEDIQIEIKDQKLYIQGEKKRVARYNQSIELSTQSSISKDELNNLDKPTIEEYDEETKQIKTISEPSTSTLSSSSSSTPISSTLSLSESALVNKSKNSNSYIIKNIKLERQFGILKRVINLKSFFNQLDLSSIKTQFNNGLLTISIHKKQDYLTTIKININ